MTDDKKRILQAETWREVEAFAPGAVGALISAAVEKKSVGGLESLVEAARAGIAFPSGLADSKPGAELILSERLQSVAILAVNNGPEEAGVLNEWLASIGEIGRESNANAIGRALDSVLKLMVGIKIKPQHTTQAHIVIKMLQENGASIERPLRDQAGKAVDVSVLERILEGDRVDLLELWYGEAMFDEQNPVPLIYPKGSYQSVSALAIELAKNENGPPSKCAQWIMSHMSEGYVDPYEAAFELGLKALSQSQGRARDVAIRSMGKIIHAGGRPSERKAGGKSRWTALAAQRCGEANLRFPAALVLECRLAKSVLEKLLDTEVISVDQTFGETLVNGGTLLHHAAGCGRKDAVLMLLQRGASPDVRFEFDGSDDANVGFRQWDGKTAADIADLVGEAEIAGILRSASAKNAMGQVITQHASSLRAND